LEAGRTAKLSSPPCLLIISSGLSERRRLATRDGLFGTGMA
jgi:hypothetical protein